ncbi:hypothetical protein CRE_23084 [Caenorhabditis remanei]|uniref:F-box domain-containing protein n=1 Tax=Caenorhabditis remanei TaxID=31234 RepID=E3N9E8_CAERE|nr:hypothetical protein CRE_23084 [Caenorhabditis remanei]
MEHTFPLLRLPENVIIEVIRNFAFIQLFEFSLVSTKSKDLVTSLGLKKSNVDIGVSNLLRVSVISGENYLRLTFYDEPKYQNELSPIDITLPVAAYVRYEGVRIQSSTPLNFSNWFNHIKTVFCFTKPRNIRFSPGCERFDLQLLKDTIGNIHVLFLNRRLTDVVSRQLLTQFNTPKILFLCKNPFEEACQTQQVLIQNFETIEFDDVYTLDDMLLVNSEKVRFAHPTTQNQFNRFLKHWIRGSNPRLQRMSLAIDNFDFVRGEINLNGIRRMEMSEEAKREIREKHSLPIHVDMIKIKRNDDIPAVIVTETRESENIHFIVLGGNRREFLPTLY